MQSNFKRRQPLYDSVPRRGAGDEPVRVGRGAVHVVRSSDPAAPFGRTTVSFFSEGDRHEAAGWRDVVLPPDDEPEPSVKAGSFDRVPRQPSSIIALAVFGVALVAGVGLGVRAMFRTGWRISSSASEFARTPAPAPLPAPAPSVTPLPPTPAPPPAPAALPAAAAAVTEPAEPPADDVKAAQAAPAPERAVAASADEGALAKGPTEHDDVVKQAAPVKRAQRARAPRRSLLPADEVLERQGNPATTGDLAPAQPIDEPSIAPPPVVAPPPEKAAPPPPADPFEL